LVADVAAGYAGSVADARDVTRFVEPLFAGYEFAFGINCAGQVIVAYCKSIHAETLPGLQLVFGQNCGPARSVWRRLESSSHRLGLAYQLLYFSGAAATSTRIDNQYCGRKKRNSS
jgi:hypothetical protein